jgi:drug/metabolite transporter (DMT)-like permease
LVPATPPAATKTEGNNKKTIVIVAFIIIALIGIAMLAMPSASTSGQTNEQRIFEETFGGAKMANDHSPPLQQQADHSGTDPIGLFLAIIGAVGTFGSFYYYHKKSH